MPARTPMGTAKVSRTRKAATALNTGKRASFLLVRRTCQLLRARAKLFEKRSNMCANSSRRGTCAASMRDRLSALYHADGRRARKEAARGRPSFPRGAWEGRGAGVAQGSGVSSNSPHRTSPSGRSMFTLHLRLLDADLLLSPPWSGLPPALPYPLLALVCLGPLALLAWLYAYELRLVSRLSASGLLGLRLVVLTLLLLLVCLQPVYARTRTEQLPGRVLVVVDRSWSLDVADPQREPVDKLRLARALKLGGDLVPAPTLDRW